jgi:CHASE2 domain-containing sensor protein
MKKILGCWDRLGIYLLLMAYGAYSTIYPLVSLRQTSPYWAVFMLGVEFFAAGLFLILGLVYRPGFRMLGLLVVALGLTTISLAIAAYGGAPRLAYAFLFGAFAMQAISDIREEKRKRKARKEEEQLLTDELVQLVADTGLREKP